MSDRPTIAHVLHRLYLAGAEVLAAALARRLRDRFHFVFLCLDEIGPLGHQLASEGFQVVDLKRRPGIDLAVPRRIRQVVRDQRVRLLHAHQYTPFFYASISRGPLGLLRAKPPVLFTEHGRHYPDIRKTKRVIANRFLLRGNDRATAVGRFVRQALVEKEGLRESRIEVVYNGIDPAQFAGDSAALSGASSLRAAVRQELGLTEQQVAVFQVARFHPVKDHETAIRGFAAALRAGTANQTHASASPVLVLVGDGDGRGKCEALVRELNLTPHVKFLGVRSDVARLIQAADIFMLSSLSEGISVTLLEAMGASLPIVATDVGGNGEVVAHGVSGLLSPRSDAQGLGRNIAALASDAALRQRMGRAGHERLLATFTQQQMHDRYAAIYEEMTV